MTLAAGTQLGPYEVIAPLGAGGMGEVYRARDERLGREVAVKVLPERLAREPDRLRRFEVEARAAGALNHPNVLVIHDIGQEDDRPYVVYELLEGQTLSERIRSGSLTRREAIDFAVQTARGLAAAHAKEIVHRDLKPDNLFITEDGRVKILDFGLAKLLRPEPQDLDEIEREEETRTRQPSTGEGVVLGTVGYMSPEQVRGVPADHRTDIFSFGVVLYEMLSGRRPFEKETAAETLTAILREDPPDLSGPDVSPATAQIVGRCLDKKPEARFQSAHDLAFALGAVSGLESRARSTAGPAPEKTPPGWGRKLVTWTLELVAVVGLGVGLWYAFAPSGPLELVNPVQLTSDGTWKEALATDGQWLYYSTHDGRLFQMSVKGGQPAELDPWGGDGKKTYVVGVSPADPTQLLVRSSADSLPWDTQLAPLPAWSLSLPAATPRRLGELVVTSATWSRNGEQIAFSDDDGIGVADATGGSARNIDAPKGFQHSAVLFDWTTRGELVHMQYTLTRNHGELCQMRPDESERECLLPDWPLSHFWGARWTPDGRHLLFSSGWQHTGALWALEKGATQPVQLTRDPLNCQWLVLDPRAERVYATCSERRGEIFVYRPEIDEWLPYPFPAETSARHLSFSRDGEWVAYVRYPEGTLWRCRRDGTRKLQLTQPGRFYAHSPRWSPDGERIAFAMGTMKVPVESWVVSRDGQGLKRVSGEGEFENNVDWSPDGRVVVSSGWGGDHPIRLVDPDTGEVEELPGTDVLAGVASSPDGRYLAAHDYGAKVSGEAWQIRLLDWQTGEWRSPEGLVGGMLQWSPDGRYLYYEPGDQRRLRRLRLDDGQVEDAVDMGGMTEEDWWYGFDPEDRLIRLRTLTTSEIYAWDLKVP